MQGMRKEMNKVGTHQALRKIREAKRSGRCFTEVRTRRSPGGRAEAEATVCGREAVQDGRCREHYLRDVLKVRDRQSGYGAKTRPFAGWQLPLGRMSAPQHEALKSLPISTPLEQCIARMNAADPENPLAACTRAGGSRIQYPCY